MLATRQGPGDELLLSWIRERHGVLAFPIAGQYLNEVKRNRAVMELLQRYEQGGQIKKVSPRDLADADREIQRKSRQSNDPHILSLALASGARVLCSNDGDLRSDFKNRSILPSVGRRQRLLYPFGGDRRTRRGFLNRQRCPNRQPN